MRKIHAMGLIIDFYESNVKENLNNIKSVAWGSTASQEKRFKILSEVALLDNKSLLDVGCGLGDFYGWLKYRHKYLDYTGIDITPSMIEIAKANHPEAQFKNLDILELKSINPTYDYVFASGIFNRRIPNHKKFIRDVIKQMYCLCKEAVAFNVMSTQADFMGAHEYYGNPSKMLDYCLELSRKVTLRHDYMPHDFTVYLYK